jgi:CRP-like cAMP-binding protein
MQAFLEQFRIFTPEEISDFLAIGKKRLIKKNEFFIREGMIAKEVGFVLSGALRSFYFSTVSDEVTYCFTFPDTLISAYSSYITGHPTPENIQALIDTEMLVFPADAIKQLVDADTKWLRFAKILAELQYIEMEKRILTLQIEPAEVKYGQLVNEHPEILQMVPLQYIASYLGISQRHLSRLRQKK